jgi:hypothetical protein
MPHLGDKSMESVVVSTSSDSIRCGVSSGGEWGSDQGESGSAVSRQPLAIRETLRLWRDEEPQTGDREVRMLLRAKKMRG